MKPISVAMPTSCASHCPVSPFDCPPSSPVAGILANNPTERTPHKPPIACAEIEPPGSSTDMCTSNHSTENVTSAPANRPIAAAAAGLTNAHAPLLAASPPIQPLAASDASGLPKRACVITAAVSAAGAADQIVLIAASTVWPGSAPLYRIAPAEFNPSQPTNASTQPRITSTPLCPGIAVGIPPCMYLPRRAPKSQAMESAVNPPTA